MTEGGAVLAVAEDVLHGGPVPVPVLHGGGLARCGHVQVGQDERVAVDRLSARQVRDGQGALAGVQGTAPPRPRVSGDLGRVQPDPEDQQPGGGGPPVRAVRRHGDLRIVHLDGIGPGQEGCMIPA
jgi:hypothetical protein